MKILNVYSLRTVEFQREEGLNWERGILVNDAELIYDLNGKSVDSDIWDMRFISTLYAQTVYGDVEYDPSSGILKIEVKI